MRTNDDDHDQKAFDTRVMYVLKFKAFIIARASLYIRTGSATIGKTRENYYNIIIIIILY